jgi:hypothetical protein
VFSFNGNTGDESIIDEDGRPSNVTLTIGQNDKIDGAINSMELTLVSMPKPFLINALVIEAIMARE